MFDIGFAELILISVVALLVIGPERLPGAIRTGSLWLSKFKRGFNDIKREVQQELHNDGVMQELRKTGEDLKEQANSIQQDVKKATESAVQSVAPDATTNDKTKSPVEKNNA
jgi:sec-independent protein translocase protein TatB